MITLAGIIVAVLVFSLTILKQIQPRGEHKLTPSQERQFEVVPDARP